MKPYYQAEGVVIFHGDCREVMRSPVCVPSGLGMILTDLPYGITNCAWDTPLGLDGLWDIWRQIISPERAIVLTASQPFTSRLVMSNPEQFKHEWIWEKNAGSNFGNVKLQPMKEHESVLVFGYGKVLYKPIMQPRAASGLSRVRSGVVNYDTETTVYNDGFGKVASARPDLRYPRSIQRFNRERGLHPTQKPVDLLAYLIQTYTEGGETVLDCCMGSGSTLVAAKKTGRLAIGIEIEEKYCEAAARRLQQVTVPQYELPSMGADGEACDQFGHILSADGSFCKSCGHVFGDQTPSLF